MIKLITVFDKHEDFIKMQYDSIVKHIKGEYEYIIFNNASTEKQAIINKKICDELKIKCIRISVNYDMEPSYIAGSALNEAFKYVTNELVFKIDSDMFFISDININELFYNSDLIYTPTYQTNKEFMWSGFFGLNLKKIDLNINFNPHVISETDTFGQSCLLTNDNRYSKKIFEIYYILDSTSEILNCGFNNDCSFKIKNDELIQYDRKEFYDMELLNKDNRIVLKVNEIVSKAKKYSFPKPYHIDIITLNDVDLMIHFKSSNHDKIYNNLEYTIEKKMSLKNFLNNN
jgi:hypothetical protein